MLKNFLFILSLGLGIGSSIICMNNKDDNESRKRIFSEGSKEADKSETEKNQIHAERKIKDDNDLKEDEVLNLSQLTLKEIPLIKGLLVDYLNYWVEFKTLSLKDYFDLNSLAYSPDNKYLVSGGLNSAIKIWDADTFKVLIEEQYSNIKSPLAYSPDNKYLALNTRTGIRILDNTKSISSIKDLEGAVCKTLNGSDRRFSMLTSLTFSPDNKYLASVSENGKLKIWDTSTFKELKAVEIGRPDNDAGGSLLAFSHDSKYLALRTQNLIIIFEVGTLEILKIFNHSNLVFCLAFSPNGKYLASGGYDNTIKIWDMDKDSKTYLNTNCIVTLDTEKGNHANLLEFSPDGKYLASGSYDRTIKIWDANTFKLLQTINTSEIAAISFSRNSKQLASLSISFGRGNIFKEIKIWKLAL